MKLSLRVLHTPSVKASIDAYNNKPASDIIQKSHIALYHTHTQDHKIKSHALPITPKESRQAVRQYIVIIRNTIGATASKEMHSHALLCNTPSFNNATSW